MLMKIHSLLVYARPALLAMATFWSVTAACLSANGVINVRTELSSYWLCLLVVICSGFRPRGSQIHRAGRFGVFGRTAFAPCALLVVIAAWFLSNQAFLFWKMRAIPSRGWQRMASDLEKAGRMSAEDDGRSFGAKGLPDSLRLLGSPEDLVAGRGQWINRSAYAGLVAYVHFGNKARNWGLFVGPERLAQEQWRDFKLIRVGQNAFFFIGAGG